MLTHLLLTYSDFQRFYKKRSKVFTKLYHIISATGFAQTSDLLFWNIPKFS